ncbi:MAG TPA: hypothetical protein VEA69_00190 [Tepidisphaeraceae bacterium]|nr:hypothetical protein [Tepidisphaeraceae bacterium]
MTDFQAWWDGARDLLCYDAASAAERAWEEARRTASAEYSRNSRHAFAGFALCGLLAGGKEGSLVPRMAVEYADALVAELERRNQPPS